MTCHQKHWSRFQTVMYNASQLKPNPYQIAFALSLDNIIININKILSCISTILTNHLGVNAHVILGSYQTSLDIKTPYDFDDLELVINDIEDQPMFSLSDLLTYNIGRLVMVPFIINSTLSSIPIICIHHVCFDGYSIKLLQQEFSQYYIDHTISIPRHTFQDFIQEEKQYLLSPKYTKALDWFQTYIRSDYVLDLPYGVKSGKKRHLHIITRNTGADKWKQLLNIYSISDYMLFHMLLTLVIALYTDQSTVLLTGAITTRSLKYQHNIGPYVNMVVYPYHINRDHTLNSFIQQSKHTYFKVNTYSLCPKEDYYRETTQLLCSNNPSPLSSDLFTTQSLQHSPKYDIHINLDHSGHDSIQCSWMFSESLFHQTTIIEMIQSFWAYLDLLYIHSQDPTVTIRKLSAQLSLQYTSKQLLKTNILD